MSERDGGKEASITIQVHPTAPIHLNCSLWLKALSETCGPGAPAMTVHNHLHGVRPPVHR